MTIFNDGDIKKIKKFDVSLHCVKLECSGKNASVEIPEKSADSFGNLDPEIATVTCNTCHHKRVVDLIEVNIERYEKEQKEIYSLNPINTDRILHPGEIMSGIKSNRIKPDYDTVYVQYDNCIVTAHLWFYGSMFFDIIWLDNSHDKAKLKRLKRKLDAEDFTKIKSSYAITVDDYHNFYGQKFSAKDFKIWSYERKIEGFKL